MVHPLSTRLRPAAPSRTGSKADTTYGIIPAIARNIRQLRGLGNYLVQGIFHEARILAGHGLGRCNR
ncbi:hypothetical protein, partial [Aureimonas sp. AU4]|uniref:hypothetical protein n=1 Tax=Aureimonas sp. AU4 TaxID=1638163 RepID=UPI001AEC55F8